MARANLRMGPPAIEQTIFFFCSFLETPGPRFSPARRLGEIIFSVNGGFILFPDEEGTVP
jgi:hypothetical protein